MTDQKAAKAIALDPKNPHVADIFDALGLPSSADNATVFINSGMRQTTDGRLENDGKPISVKATVGEQSVEFTYNEVKGARKQVRSPSSTLKYIDSMTEARKPVRQTIEEEGRPPISRELDAEDLRRDLGQKALKITRALRQVTVTAP